MKNIEKNSWTTLVHEYVHTVWPQALYKHYQTFMAWKKTENAATWDRFRIFEYCCTRSKLGFAAEAWPEMIRHKPAR